MKDISDIQTATHCLHQLLGVLYEVSTELRYTLADGSHDATAERVASLLILARDETERIDGAVGDIIASEVHEAQGELGVIHTLGEEYEEALEAWNAAGKAADAPDASEELKAEEAKSEARHDMYRDALFNFKSQHPAAMAEKATILLRVWNRADGMSDERIVQLLQSMGGRA